MPEIIKAIKEALVVILEMTIYVTLVIIIWEAVLRERVMNRILGNPVPDPELLAEIQSLKNELSVLRSRDGNSVGKKSLLPRPQDKLDLGNIPDYPKIEPSVVAPLNKDFGWAHLKASVRGKGKSELQDSLGFFSSVSSVLLVVCDGAGSKPRSKQGADHCAAGLVSEFSQIMGDGARLSPSNWRDVSLRAFLNVAKSLEVLAQSQNNQLADFGCTGIVVVATDDFVGCAHVGDGRAGFLDENNCWRSILTPFKGSEANATVFMSMLAPDNSDKLLETTSHQIRTRSVIALSDGPEGVCWHISTKDRAGTKVEDPNVPSANFFTKIANQLVAATESKVPQDQLDKLWGDFLAGGNPQLSEETDDKTLLIAIRG